MPLKYVPVEGVATFLHHRGPTTLPESPPSTEQGETIVCLHDAGANGAHFDPVLDELAARDSPLAFDQPGHGRSGGIDSLGSIGRMAGFALSLHRTLGLAPAIWLGEGLGAAVALELARREPGVVRGLALVGRLAPWAPAPELLEELDEVVAGRRRRRFDASGFAKDTPRPVFERAFREWTRTDPRVLRGDQRALRDHEPGPAPGVPVRIWIGAEAPEVRRKAASELARELAAPAPEPLVSSGLHPSLEQPETLARGVSGFCRELAA